MSETEHKEIIPDLLTARIEQALDRIAADGGVDGAHHKQWVLDQVVRVLTGCEYEWRTTRLASGADHKYPHLGTSPGYEAWVAEHNDGEDGPNTYSWDEGIPP